MQTILICIFRGSLPQLMVPLLSLVVVSTGLYVIVPV